PQVTAPHAPAPSQSTVQDVACPQDTPPAQLSSPWHSTVQSHPTGHVIGSGQVSGPSHSMKHRPMPQRVHSGGQPGWGAASIGIPGVASGTSPGPPTGTHQPRSHMFEGQSLGFEQRAN
ncbi:MAG TPA: hypothetical protein VNM90_07165, partial [Haliangium sp.]|nr:hypothetical protein [Haliangium sp.]